LLEGVRKHSSLISETGYINADFNDAKSVMQNAGTIKHPKEIWVMLQEIKTKQKKTYNRQE